MRENLTIEVGELAEADSKGYSSIVLALARRRRHAGETPARVIGVTPTHKSLSIHGSVPMSHGSIPMGSHAFGKVAPQCNAMSGANREKEAVT
jgi:hypothetical protein